MSLTKIGDWTNPIINEADRPNRTAQDMKTIFDANSNQIKEAYNASMDALELAEATIQVDETHPNRYLSLDGTYTVPEAGEAANGVKIGGTAGQVYVKQSAADYDGGWVTIRPAVYEIELPATAWGGNTSCTLSVPGKGVSADAILFTAPIEEDYEESTAKGVRCTGAGTDTLSFKCDEIPGDLGLHLTVWHY